MSMHASCKLRGVMQAWTAAGQRNKHKQGALPGCNRMRGQLQLHALDCQDERAAQCVHTADFVD